MLRNAAVSAVQGVTARWASLRLVVGMKKPGPRGAGWYIPATIPNVCTPSHLPCRWITIRRAASICRLGSAAGGY